MCLRGMWVLSLKDSGWDNMKWIIWTAIAIPAVLHWGLMGAMWMSIAAAVMLENRKEEKHL